MKVIILCAGLGSRTGGLSQSLFKFNDQECLIENIKTIKKWVSKIKILFLQLDLSII